MIWEYNRAKEKSERLLDSTISQKVDKISSDFSCSLQTSISFVQKLAV